MFQGNELIRFPQSGGGWSLKYNTEEEDIISSKRQHYKRIQYIII